MDCEEHMLLIILATEAYVHVAHRLKADGFNI